MLEAWPFRTQGSDAAGALEGRGLQEGSAPLPGPKARSLGSEGERFAYLRLTEAEEGQQVIGETWEIAR